MKYCVKYLSVIIFLCGYPSFILADFKAAVQAYDKGDYITAMRELKADGSSVALFNIGIMYENGDGVRQDRYEATNWYRLAAQVGFTPACYALFGIHKDFLQARQDPPYSWQEAKEWGKKAAETYEREAIKGKVEAMYRLAEIYDPGIAIYGPEKLTTLIWLRKAAKAGHQNAQALLGFAYENGDGVPQNQKEANYTSTEVLKIRIARSWRFSWLFPRCTIFDLT